MNSQEHHPRGAMLLQGCSIRIVSTTDFCFQLIVPSSSKVCARVCVLQTVSLSVQTYFMFAPNETQLDEWVGAVADASVLSLALKFTPRPSQQLVPSRDPLRTPCVLAPLAIKLKLPPAVAAAYRPLARDDETKRAQLLEHVDKVPV